MFDAIPMGHTLRARRPVGDASLLRDAAHFRVPEEGVARLEGRGNIKYIVLPLVTAFFIVCCSMPDRGPLVQGTVYHLEV